MKYSIIFLVDEESEEFTQLFEIIYRLLEKRTGEFEILVVANGTERFVQLQLNSTKNHLDDLRIISFQRTVPQPVCLKAALGECSGKLILTLAAFQELTADSYEKVINSMADGENFIGYFPIG